MRLYGLILDSASPSTGSSASPDDSARARHNRFTCSGVMSTWPAVRLPLAAPALLMPARSRIELAHAHFPPPYFGVSAPGDVHFNNALTWSDDAADGGDADVDFQTVALHELGHSLGLLHSNAAGAVMNPFYAGGRRVLTADDIGGIQAIYGPQGLPPCVPPPSAYAASFHSYPGFDINNPIHAGFPKCEPLPASGESSSHSFASFFEGDMPASLFGVTEPDEFVHVLGFGDTGVKVTHVGRGRDQVFFDTEMTQLDIKGEGSDFAGQNDNGILYEGVLLPRSIVIRLDPDRPSTGQIVLDERRLQLDSFFDVFTEVSMDGGQTFAKSLDSSHMKTSYNFFPEPSTLAILVIGAAAISLRGSREKRRSE